MGLERNPFSYRRGATLAQKDNEMECHAGAQANLPVAVFWNPIPTQNWFSVFQETEGDGENLEPSDSKMQNQFPLMRESIRVLGERTDEAQRSMPRAKFPRKEPAEGRKKRLSLCGQARRRHATQSRT